MSNTIRPEIMQQQPSQQSGQGPFGFLNSLMPYAAMLFPEAAPFIWGAQAAGGLMNGQGMPNPAALMKFVSPFNPYGDSQGKSQGPMTPSNNPFAPSPSLALQDPFLALFGGLG